MIIMSPMFLKCGNNNNKNIGTAEGDGVDRKLQVQFEIRA